MNTPIIYNLGSLNLDRVFRVPHIASPGETLAASSLTTYPGGKGANQSVALARAGARVVHIGRIGTDGQMLRERLADEGVDVRHVVEMSDTPSGQAIIQVDDQGQNSIVILAGANGAITAADIEAALADAPACSWLLAQNETSCVGDAMRLAKQRGLKVAFNPAPADERVRGYPAELVDLWCLNEMEHRLLHDLLPRELASDQEVLLTRGAGGPRCGGRMAKCICRPSPLKLSTPRRPAIRSWVTTWPVSLRANRPRPVSKEPSAPQRFA